MKKDLNEQELSEKQLGNVQGGTGGNLEEKVTTHCLHSGCTWQYTGPKEKAAIAQQNHTKATGHNQFA